MQTPDFWGADPQLSTCFPLYSCRINHSFLKCTVLFQALYLCIYCVLSAGNNFFFFYLSDKVLPFKTHLLVKASLVSSHLWVTKTFMTSPIGAPINPPWTLDSHQSSFGPQMHTFHLLDLCPCRSLSMEAVYFSTFLQASWLLLGSFPYSRVDVLTYPPTAPPTLHPPTSKHLLRLFKLLNSLTSLLD